MKKSLFILMALYLISINLKADFQGSIDYENFKAKKIAFLTSSINLTPAEAEVFWPVYNEYEQKKYSLMQEKKEIEKKIRQNIETLTDQECIEISKKLAFFEKTEGELEVEYNLQFLKILPPKKVLKIGVAEMEFKGHLLREYRKDNREGERDRSKN